MEMLYCQWAQSDLNTVICRVGDDRSGTPGCSFIFRSFLSPSSSSHVGCGLEWDSRPWWALKRGSVNGVYIPGHASRSISPASLQTSICAGPLGLQDDWGIVGRWPCCQVSVTVEGETVRLPPRLKMTFLGALLETGWMVGGESTYLIFLNVSCHDTPHTHPAVLALLGHLAL